MRRDNDPLLERLIEAGGEILSAGMDPEFGQLKVALSDHAILLDGVLGTGIKLPLRGKVATVLKTVKDFLAKPGEDTIVVAVDCPSGVDCDTGETAPESIPADMTVTMAGAKVGLFGFPAAAHVGDLRLVGIGNLDQLTSWNDLKCFVADRDFVRQALPQRPGNAHKGTFGTVMVVAGSTNYTGAVVLAGKAAYRLGVGLVTSAVPATVYGTLAGHFPEGTWLLLPDELGVIAGKAANLVLKNLDRTSTMLMGPGFGVEETTRDFIERLLTQGQSKERSNMGFVKSDQEKMGESDQRSLPPMVLDADGLKLLARIPDWPSKVPTEAILTPHPGEMSIRTGLEIREIQADRLGTARRFANEWGHVVALKGAFTIVAAPDGKAGLIPVATPALARAGTGDVLAGMIAGLRAQGVGAFEAAVAGAWMHAAGGLLAEEYLGSTTAVMAGDLLDAIIDVVAEIAN
jgi:NAD(P)H-hydrate epimerase